MSAFDRFGRVQRDLPEILTSIAAPRVPDYVDDILAQTAATRQRPRWTFLERWLPMGVLARRSVFFPSVPWRTLVAIAVLLALLAAALFIAGARTKVPAPFGVARNGVVLYSDGHDMFVRDTIDGTSRIVAGGATEDFTGGFTRDGTRLTYLRRTAGTEGSDDERIDLIVARGDGSDPVDVSGPLIAPNWWDLAPDDRYVVVAAGASTFGAHQQLFRIDLQGPGAPKLIDVGPTLAVGVPGFRGPDGGEVIFRGSETAVNKPHVSGIYAIHPDGSGLRRITTVDGNPDTDYLSPQPSPDGRLVAYTDWDEAVQRNRIHVIDLATGADRLFTTDSRLNDGWATFSPDSNLLLFIEYSGNRSQIMVRPVDGSSQPVGFGPTYAQSDGGTSGLFSPDGTKVVVNDWGTKETRIIDTAVGGNGTVLPWGSGNLVGWQRLAP